MRDRSDVSAQHIREVPGSGKGGGGPEAIGSWPPRGQTFRGTIYHVRNFLKPALNPAEFKASLNPTSTSEFQLHAKSETSLIHPGGAGPAIIRPGRAEGQAGKCHIGVGHGITPPEHETKPDFLFLAAIFSEM